MTLKNGEFHYLLAVESSFLLLCDDFHRTKRFVLRQLRPRVDAAVRCHRYLVMAMPRRSAEHAETAS